MNFFETQNITPLQRQVTKMVEYYINHILPDPNIFNQLDTATQQEVMFHIPLLSELISSTEYPKISPEYQEKLTKSRKNDIQELFRYYPELQELGTQEEYLSYLQNTYRRAQLPIFYH